MSQSYKLSHTEELLDKREIHKRRHDGKVCLLPKLNHFKCIQDSDLDPTYRAMHEWNTLDVELRNALTKEQFGNGFMSQIMNPYKK